MKHYYVKHNRQLTIRTSFARSGLFGWGISATTWKFDDAPCSLESCRSFRPHADASEVQPRVWNADIKSLCSQGGLRSCHTLSALLVKTTGSLVMQEIDNDLPIKTMGTAPIQNVRRRNGFRLSNPYLQGGKIQCH